MRTIFVLAVVAGLFGALSPAGAATDVTELAMFDPGTGKWHVRDAGGSTHTFYYGVPGDTPLLGDWDCDGSDTIGMYRAATGFVYLRNSNTQGFADLEFYFGLAGDIPLAGDWNGNGCDTLSIFRNSQVFISNELGTRPADYSYHFGVPGDRPFSGDFDGDGTTTVGLYRTGTGYAYLRNSNDTGVADIDFFYGIPSDRIIAGDWDGDGDDTVGIFRPSEGRFYLSNENGQGVADIEVQFGEAGFLPVAGNIVDLGDPPPDPGTAELWSDPTTWGGAVPASGAAVTIPAGKTVLLDVSPPQLGAVTVQGTLIFDEQDLSLTANSMMVAGTLQIGTAADPFDHDATITLNGFTPVGSMGARGLVVMGGTLDLHGAPEVSWSKLSQNAALGATQVRLTQNVGWSAGDQIVISSTDFDPEQAEERTITEVVGNLVRFAEPLEHPHWGTIQSFDGRLVDERAEVGRLNRNITIQGPSGSVGGLFGAHLMIMPGSTARIEHAEFFHMGQAGELGRYPVHWHQAGDSAGSYLRSSAIHHSFNRCVTVHGAHNVRIEDNVAFDTFGHCFFLEDGIEQGNVFDHNLGLMTRKADPALALLPSDHQYPGPGTFWISNPANTFTNNVAAGSEGIGFWVALSEHPTGPSATDTVWPRQTPLTRFDGNVAHSNDRDGLHVDRGASSDGSTETTWYEPHLVPGDEDSPTVTAVFDNFTAYKNRNNGAWLRGEDHVVRGAVLADNSAGVTFASNESELIDSIVVGETANLGHPRSWEEVGPNGRSLPLPWDAGFGIRGFEFYDGEVGVRNTYFAGFVPRSQRQASALSVLDFTNFSLDSDNYASGLSFASGTKRVYLETRGIPTDPDESEDGYRSAVFRDLDGSLTGTANRAVTVDNPILVDGSCEFRSDWNAWICDRRYEALLIDNRSHDGTDMGSITVTRNGGASHTMLGTPNDGPNERFRTSVLHNRDYTVDASGPWPDHYQIRTRDVATGESLHVAISGFSGTPNLYRDWWIDERNRLEPVASLSALLASDGSSYYLTGSTLHLLLVPQDGRDWTAVDLCRTAGC